MIGFKGKKKVRGSSRLKHEQTQRTEELIHSKHALRRLSFSFYGEDTIKKSKQVILDNCEILDDLPVFTQPAVRVARKGVHSSRPSSGLSKSRRSGKIQSIQYLLVDGKCDQIEIVPTNASHYDMLMGDISQQKLFCKTLNLNRGKMSIKGKVVKGSGNKKNGQVLEERSKVGDQGHCKRRMGGK